MKNRSRSPIKGVRVIPLTAHSDDRGFLMEIARHSATSSEPHSVVDRFGQIYLVGNPVRYTVRAFHKHHTMTDWFCVVKGSAMFILVDGREDCPSFEKEVRVVVSERSPKLLTIPPDVWHGWMSLEDNTLLISIASHPYNAKCPDEVRISPTSFGTVWEVKGR